MKHLNIEIKAKCKHPDQIHEILRKKGADFLGVDHQVDTYYNAPNGRLKMREGLIENALIHYLRPNQSGPKKSEVLLYQFKADQGLKQVLEAANGILTVVDKKRAIYFIENVKFHVDEVEGLGSFVEIEAIDKDGSFGEEKLNKQCQEFLHLLDIKKEDLIDHSYSDMLIKKK
ncbi:MAG: class IV adenylate cyclase [Saprospiraceae bacterium]|nr:class IV adenylate cyclase [Saprospiraceae bacterium]